MFSPFTINPFATFKGGIGRGVFSSYLERIVTSLLGVLSSSGSSFSTSLIVLDSDGNSFTVTNSVLDSDGNSFTVV